MFRFEVIVRLKDGLLDPQGKAIQDSLPHLGWTNVSSVRVGKHVELSVEAEDIAHRLLANPVIEEARVGLAQEVRA